MSNCTFKVNKAVKLGTGYYNNSVTGFEKKLILWHVQACLEVLLNNWKRLCSSLAEKVKSASREHLHFIKNSNVLFIEALLQEVIMTLELILKKKVNNFHV